MTPKKKYFLLYALGFNNCLQFQEEIVAQLEKTRKSFSLSKILTEDISNKIQNFSENLQTAFTRLKEEHNFFDSKYDEISVAFGAKHNVQAWAIRECGKIYKIFYSRAMHIDGVKFFQFMKNSIDSFEKKLVEDNRILKQIEKTAPLVEEFDVEEIVDGHGDVSQKALVSSKDPTTLSVLASTVESDISSQFLRKAAALKDGSHDKDANTGAFATDDGNIGPDGVVDVCTGDVLKDVLVSSKDPTTLSVPASTVDSDISSQVLRKAFDDTNVESHDDKDADTGAFATDDGNIGPDGVVDVCTDCHGDALKDLLVSSKDPTTLSVLASTVESDISSQVLREAAAPKVGRIALSHALSGFIR